jgi:hypothetical protein
MTNLHFENLEEFTTLFREKNKEVSDAIRIGVENAMMNRKKSAELFQLTFADADDAYEITLPEAIWETALESCLNFYHENEHTDEAIDTWKLLEAVKA